MAKKEKLAMAAARINAGLTQQDIANSIGVSVQTVINWETGKIAPTIPQYIQFVKICGVSVDSIIIPF